ncbi:hypothetical protein ACJJTC_002238 [Scirpophaga incertulas]
MSRRLQDKEILSILQNIREDESDCGSESAERDSDDDCAVPQFSSSSSSEESDLEDQVPLATLQNVHSSSSRGHGRGGAHGRGRGRGRGRSHSSDDSELQGLITATDGKLLILTSVGVAVGYPTTTEVDPTAYETTNADVNVTKLYKDVALVSYIQNFKNVMAAYVSSQYKNLTVTEMEKVKVTLEEFLTSFAKDLREYCKLHIPSAAELTNTTIQPKKYIYQSFAGDIEEVPDKVTGDGIPDGTFKDIKIKIVQEFPDIKEETAETIVLKLRKNLFETRHRLDQIIRDSQRAQTAYSSL